MTMWCVAVLVGALSLVNASPTPYLLDFPENVRGSMTRIVSGWEANQGDFPFQLSLRMIAADGRVFACGATVIHSEWALTAAHCTAQRVTLVIRAGGVALSHPQLIFETTEYYNYPDYNENIPTVVQPHDIGVIKFNRVLQFSEQPPSSRWLFSLGTAFQTSIRIDDSKALVFGFEFVPLPRMQASVDRNKNYQGVRLQASGWGATWTGGSSPEVLNWVYLVGTSNVFCREVHGGSPIIVDSTICAGGYNVTSQSTCQGDSGGPLLTVDDDGGLTQVGISSFVSSSGCHTDYPAGFIRPGHYHEWLTEVTGINFDWDPSSAIGDEDSMTAFSK